jgi:membrane associated rhomboid family serine protease
MLLVPIPEGVDWRRPPPVTVFLIVLNALVFFGYQAGDAAREREVERRYFDSQLPAIELPLYREHLARVKPEIAAKVDEAPREWLFLSMENDPEFMRALHAGEIVQPANDRYATWREERARVDEAEGRISYRRFGFTPADPRPLNWLASLFLHGSVEHLVGNMVFLFILGVTVEAPLGGGWFLALYLLSGVAGNALHMAMNPGSAVPLVGASGAISGVMGLFAVVFGLRPVRFFYWLFVVFGFRLLRGLLVLPLWIGWEAAQYFMNRHSSIGYMAHAGGLLAGSLFGAVVRHRVVAERVERFHEAREGEANDRADYEKARALAQKLDYAAASAIFARLAKRLPDDAEMIRQWHAIARRTPQSPHYPAACSAALALAKTDAPTRAWQLELFREYLKLSGPAARLNPAGLSRAARVFVAAGELAEAQAAADILFRIEPGHRHLPAIWDLLAKAFAQRHADAASVAQAKRYRTLIAARAKARTQPG